MSPRVLMAAPAAVFAAVVIAARLSGNDKSPFLVLLVLGLLALLLLVLLGVAWLGGPDASKPWPLIAGTALPLAYAGLVVLLARAQLIDPLNWLGLR
ncbi:MULTISPECIES: hypothetical protein [Roseateles]|uniref:Peptidoglycan/LPS O-acetylase OafA/YrhL n=1 Tax=Pelomonas aquatica TaxID=431058 RepID=A0ABU1ZEE2_9BURK|nr:MULTISPECIES: hypothetical protein [Roseateles]KQY86037.1 hypothetical protein ASD35_20645 [Pelomonas sp. Root1444]MDR7298335.1 peptidoglycan/LPS O-acetylase OafA/YrhL [Pelomonas aquatica]